MDHISCRLSRSHVVVLGDGRDVEILRRELRIGHAHTAAHRHRVLIQALGVVGVGVGGRGSVWFLLGQCGGQTLKVSVGLLAPEATVGRLVSHISRVCRVRYTQQEVEVLPSLVAEGVASQDQPPG